MRGVKRSLWNRPWRSRGGTEV